jgi:DNA-binding protein Fis
MMDLKLTLKSALQYNRTLRKLENYEKGARDDVKFYQRMLNINSYDVLERMRSYDTASKRTPVLIRSEPGCRPGMLAKIISQVVDDKLYFEKVCHGSLKNIIPHNIQNGDTLFLEGVENLHLEEQRMLIRMLREIETEQVSGNNYPDFRLIASMAPQMGETNGHPELAELIETMSRVEYRIEPLRLRKHELREVVSLVFEKVKRETFTRVEEVSEDLYDLLVEYNWPLNHDELFIILQSLLVTCPDATLQQKHLHQLDFSDMANTKYPTLDDVVDEHIKKALRLTMGNKSRAAKMLGITPKTLYARIRN